MVTVMVSWSKNWSGGTDNESVVPIGTADDDEGSRELGGNDDSDKLSSFPCDMWRRFRADRRSPWDDGRFAKGVLLRLLAPWPPPSTLLDVLVDTDDANDKDDGGKGDSDDDGGGCNGGENDDDGGDDDPVTIDGVKSAL